MKHRIVHVLQKYLLNPPIKVLLAIGLAPPGYALLETIGRNTGKPRRTPVGNGRVGNIAANPRVRVKVREGLRMPWHTGTAHVLSDDNPRDRQRWLAAQRPGSASNSAAVRFLGTKLLTVRINLDVQDQPAP